MNLDLASCPRIWPHEGREGCVSFPLSFSLKFPSDLSTAEQDRMGWKAGVNQGQGLKGFETRAPNLTQLFRAIGFPCVFPFTFPPSFPFFPPFARLIGPSTVLIICPSSPPFSRWRGRRARTWQASRSNEPSGSNLWRALADRNDDPFFDGSSRNVIVSNMARLNRRCRRGIKFFARRRVHFHISCIKR